MEEQMTAEQIKSMNDSMAKSRRRKVVNIGGNPQGHVFLLLDDGSMVGLSQHAVDLVARVNREGLDQRSN